MNVFITGGTGFIGSHVVKVLIEKGHTVSVLARNKNKVPSLINLSGVRMIEGDIAKPITFQNQLPSVDAVIHIALNWGDSAKEMLMNDTLSSVMLFEMAARAGVKTIIYTSSTSVNDWVYMDEDAKKIGSAATVYENTKQNPVTFYGATKGATELYLQAIAFEHKIRANVVRPGYTFGNPAFEGADIEADHRFRTIIEAAINGQPIEIIKNDGTQFIDASDLAKVYLAILDSSVSGKMYFGLGNKFLTWEDIARKTIFLTGSKSILQIIDKGWPSDPALFDVSSIQNDFGLSFTSWGKIVDHIKYLLSFKIL